MPKRFLQRITFLLSFTTNQPIIIPINHYDVSAPAMTHVSGFLNTKDGQQFVTSTSLVSGVITDICDITVKNICNLQAFLYTDNPGQKRWDTHRFLP
jgi:hypothetical protein